MKILNFYTKASLDQLVDVPVLVCWFTGAAWLGCAVGMAVGCLLGLTPLLFFGEAEQLDGAQADKHAHGSTSRSKAAAAAS